MLRRPEEVEGVEAAVHMDTYAEKQPTVAGGRVALGDAGITEGIGLARSPLGHLEAGRKDVAQGAVAVAQFGGQGRGMPRGRTAAPRRPCRCREDCGEPVRFRCDGLGGLRPGLAHPSREGSSVLGIVAVGQQTGPEASRPLRTGLPLSAQLLQHGPGDGGRAQMVHADRRQSHGGDHLVRRQLNGVPVDGLRRSVVAGSLVGLTEVGPDLITARHQLGGLKEQRERVVVVSALHVHRGEVHQYGRSPGLLVLLGHRAAQQVDRLVVTAETFERQPLAVLAREPDGGAGCPLKGAVEVGDGLVVPPCQGQRVSPAREDGRCHQMRR